ncbi:MAG: hypothetical protein AB7S57_26260 [Acetobacteraceae bacterium]
MNRPVAHRLLALTAALLLAAVCGLASADPAETASSTAERAPHLLWSARSPTPNLVSSPLLSVFERLDGRAPTTRAAAPRVELFAGFDGAPPSLTPSASVPWCAEASGLLRIGSLGQQCLMRGMLQFELPGQVASSEVGIGFNGQRFDLVLGFGLSRLNPVNDEFGFSRSPWQPAFGGAGSGYQPFYLASGEASGLALGGQWRLTAASALQFNAAINRLRLQNPGSLTLLDVERSELGLGMVYGSLAGQLNAHSQRAVDLGGGSTSNFNGVDIGLSWRTPWRAELSVGAENVLSSGQPTLLPNPPRNPIDNSAVRTPYVRYKQDL